MPLGLEGSCRCGRVAFRVASHTPHPYQRCYCTVCRKQAGGGGYGVNIMGVAASLEATGRAHLAVWRARIDSAPHGGAEGPCHRHFCATCAAALWILDPDWPDLVHPFASAIDTPLPVPPSLTHIMLDFKAPWVVPEVGPEDQCFERYPAQSIEDWHKARGLWVA